MNAKVVVALLAGAATSSLTGVAAQESEDASPEPVRCLSMASVRSTKVIDDQTVLFFHGRGRVYLNRLERACVGLARNGKFTFEVQTGARHARLCATDSITVLERTGRGFNCGLGMFEPVRWVEEVDPRSRSITSTAAEPSPSEEPAAPAAPPSPEP
jgi:hypothetical protein